MDEISLSYHFYPVGALLRSNKLRHVAPLNCNLPAAFDSKGFLNLVCISTSTTPPTQTWAIRRVNIGHSQVPPPQRLSPLQCTDFGKLLARSSLLFLSSFLFFWPVEC